MKILNDERGQAVVSAVLCMACLFGFVGLAVDAGLLFRAKRTAQTAADSGAIAGALELGYGDMTAAAQADAARNGITNGVNGATVTVNTPPQYGAYKGDSGYVEVIASQDSPTFFMKAFNRNFMTVTARAVAGLGASTDCIYTLTPGNEGILVNGEIDFTLTDCGIIDDANSAQALLVNGENKLSARSIGVVGKYLSSGSNTISPTPTTGIASVSDPLAFLQPPSLNGLSCNSATIDVAGSFTLGPSTPGGTVCYSSITINGTATVTFNPGLYIVTGQFLINGTTTVTGSGVTFYLPNNAASIIQNGSNMISLSAPTSGAYNGILFYEDRSDTTPMIINGENGSNLQGIIYAPNANLTINGSNSSTMYLSLVLGSFTINGTNTFSNYSDVNPSSPLTSARLVE